MMISPKAYYEEVLRGKSQTELLHEIQSLHQEINRLIREIEDPDSNTEAMVFPGPLTWIKCYRGYLEMAKKAYGDAGGNYEPTDSERRDQDFNSALAHMKRFILNYGGFFSGYAKYTYTLSGDTVFFDLEHSIYLKPSNLPAYEPFNRNEFIRGISEMHIGEWKEYYNNYNVLDGIQWSIDIEYEDARTPIHISGSNAYPYNFDELLEFLEVNTEENIQ